MRNLLSNVKKRLTRPVPTIPIDSTSILVCSIGGSDESVSLQKLDAGTYREHYPNVIEHQADNVSGFFEFLAGKSFDIVHLVATADTEETIEGHSALELFCRMTEAGAKLIVLAGEQGRALETDSFPQVTSIMTLDRKGDKFGRWLNEVVAHLAQGDFPAMAFVKVSPQRPPGPWDEDNPEVWASVPTGAPYVFRP